MKLTFVTICIAAMMVVATIAPVSLASTRSTQVGGQKSITVEGVVVSRPVTLVSRDSGTETSYIGIWYLGQAIEAAGGAFHWDASNRTFNITAPGIDSKKINIRGGLGSGNTIISINDVPVKKVNSFVAQDPASKQLDITTFVPLFYIWEILNCLGGSTWNGHVFTFNQFLQHPPTGTTDPTGSASSIWITDYSGPIYAVPHGSYGTNNEGLIAQLYDLPSDAEPYNGSITISTDNPSVAELYYGGSNVRSETVPASNDSVVFDVIATNKPGFANITATANGLSTTVPVYVAPFPHIRIDDTTFSAKAQSVHPLIITATDDQGRPISGIPIFLMPDYPEFFNSEGLVNTNAEGQATFWITSCGTVGSAPLGIAAGTDVYQGYMITFTSANIS